MVSLGGTERGTSPLNQCTPSWERFKKKSRSWFPFGSILGTNMAPTWLQKSIKNGPKSMPSYLPMLTSSCSAFLSYFYSQLGSQESAKSWFFLGKNDVFFKNRFPMITSFWNRFRCQLGSIFLPKIYQHPFKNRFRKASFFGSFLASILDRFSFDLGIQLGTKSEPLESANAP